MEDLFQREDKHREELLAHSEIDRGHLCLSSLLKSSYFIRHDGRHGASDFMVLLGLSVRAQEDEEEPGVCQQNMLTRDSSLKCGICTTAF